MNKEELKEILYSVLFVSGEGLNVFSLAAFFNMDDDKFLSLVDEIILEQHENAGILIKRFNNTIRLSTNPKYFDRVRDLFAPEIVEKLSNTVLETLSVIAYKQPVTRAEVENIRGVRCDYSISVLMQKGMIEECGKKDVIGRPILYATTDLFLEHFGLNSLNELPPVNDTEITEELGV